VSDEPTPWSVTARNLPEHAGNAIHTDAGAQSAGFPAALVAGVTTYAYLTHPVVATWGDDWLRRGGGEVRFRAPVFAGRRVDCVPTPDGDGIRIDAVCAVETDNPRAVLRAVRDAGPPPPLRGDLLPSRQVRLDEAFGADYGERAGDDLTLYADAGIAHPAVWPAIANTVMRAELVRGAWIHTRSIIRHHAPGPVDAVVDVHATLVDRFVRRGLRAVIDVLVELDGRPLASLEHEAIVDLSVG
jgi:acyl dehydratase